MVDEARAAFSTELLENVEDAVIAVDPHFVVTVWSRGAERIYGWRADEAVGGDVGRCVRFEMTAEERADERRRTVQEGRTRRDAVAVRKDGTRVDVELTNVAMRDEQGELVGFLGIHRDISERKRAEQTLRASQRRSETLLESITDAFIAVDSDWRYTYVNDPALRRIQGRNHEGITRDDVLGASMWELFPDVVGTELWDRYHEAMREQHAVEFEAYLAPLDQWIEAHAYPSETGLAVYYRDVSRRKVAEAERERRARRQALVAELGQRALAGDDLQTLMDDAVGVVALTLDIELTSVVERLSGPNELLLRAGRGWRAGAVGTRAGSPDVDSLFAYTITAGGPVISDAVAADDRFTISPLLSEHHAVSAVTVVIGGRAAPFGVLGAFSSERRSFSPDDANFLRAVAHVLATAVERSEVQEKLREAREAERRRIARALHDEAFRDLSYALAEVGGARSAAITPEVIAPLDRLVPALTRVGEQLRGAIYDLRLGIDENAPFAELLRAQVDIHRAMAVESDVALESHAEMPSGALGAVGIEVLRILGEALTNARRHSGARRVRVGVSCADRRLRATVSDDGVGFDVARMAAANAGHGIRGMRERADLMDGRLEIVSAGGVGTRVRLDVPLQDARARPMTGVRVLLVEDHAAVREALAAAFAQEDGFEVVGQAASLEQARAMLGDVDVAVLDLGLPDGYGGDLIGELRAASPRAQALVLSATLDRGEVARAIESGAAGALNKTARLHEVVDAVRRLRAGETLLPMDEVADLMRVARRRRDEEQADRLAIDDLTPREQEVLQALADGLNTHAMAEQLHITIRTARNHISSILAKLGVHSQLQALVMALRYDVVAITKGD